ncbi:hypothetical protein D8L93_09660 [Sodalis-like symbiont of Bactericera trigonica]|nr:hypothetical protein D8L93_09660 [Sodalis-like symbiont of Bactericera trigonica]
MILVTLFFCFQAVKWITRPLSVLQTQLQTRSAESVDPLPETGDINEVLAVRYPQFESAAGAPEYHVAAGQAIYRRRCA